MNTLLIVRRTVRESVRDREFPGVVFLFVFVFGALGAYYSYLEGNAGWDTAAFLRFPLYVSMILVPMVGVLLGNDLVAGPREDGRLRLLLGQPISRLSVLVGGYVAKAIVLVVSIAAGGLAAVVASRALGSSLAVDVFGRFVLLTIGLGLAYLGVSVAISALFRSTEWTTFAIFSVFLVFVLVWRFVPSGIALVGNGLEFPETQPAWVALAEGLSPSIAYEYLVDTYVVAETVPSRPNADSTPAISTAVLLWWIGLVPALAYWRFRSTDL